MSRTEGPGGGAGGGAVGGSAGSGLSRSIRALFDPGPATRPGEEAPPESARGRGPRDRLTTLSARYLQGDPSARERLAPGIEAQARLLLAAGEAEVVADAVVALARAERVEVPADPAVDRDPRDALPLAARLVDPEVERILEARLERAPDPAVSAALERAAPARPRT